MIDWPKFSLQLRQYREGKVVVMHERLAKFLTSSLDRKKEAIT